MTERTDETTNLTTDVDDATTTDDGTERKPWWFTPETASEAGRKGGLAKAARRAERKLSAQDRARLEFEAEQDAIFANMRRIASGRDEYAKASEQIAAARWLAERAYGRPDVYKEGKAVEQVEAMSEEDMRTYLAGFGIQLA